MKTLAFIVVAGIGGFLVGYLLCAIMSASARAEECTNCIVTRTLQARNQ